jgi:hypothetical protein
MTSFLIIFFLTAVQMLAGFGLLTLFNVTIKPPFYLSLALLLGIAVFSLVPFILQLLNLPVTPVTVFTSIFIETFLLNLKFKEGFKNLKSLFYNTRFTIRMYEAPFMGFICIIIFVSVWRCFYFPPTPVDVTSGAEAVAEYTVREHTMINSVFQLPQNGNSLKPAFITSLQVIYKMAGFPFGQIWLSSIFIAFTIFLYHAISQLLHRTLACILLIFFLAIPEMYAYTFMLLYDYSNAVFFFLAVFFCIRYFEEQSLKDIAFAGLLMAFAVYMRPETILLCGGILPAVFINSIKHKAGLKKMLTATAMFLMPAIFIYWVSVYLYIHNYLPVVYSIAGQVNKNLVDIKAILHSFAEANTSLVFSSQGIVYYGYFIFIFLAFLVAQLVFKRKLNTAAKNYLYCILLVYLVYPLLTHVLPGASIDYTVKRAFLKLFPLMVLFIANTSLLTGFSNWIGKWQMRQA